MQFFSAAGAYALEPPPEQALLIASFELSAPAAVEFIATASGLTTSATLQLSPGGTYEVTVMAQQPAESNSGYGTFTLTV